MLGETDVSTVGKIGRLQENLRARQRHTLYQDIADLYGTYSAFKTREQTATGLSWSMDLSYLQQWGRPHGGAPAGQVLATPGFDWTIFKDKALGEGSLQFSYVAAGYVTRQNGADVTTNLALITPINDYPTRQNTFEQLTYTQAFSDNKVLVSAGQYAFYNFDGNTYLNNQQRNFLNFALSQNGSATYPVAGLGVYAQLNATSTIQLAAGFQNAANVSGETLSGKGFGTDGFAWFGYAQWMPAFRGLGTSEYSMTLYEVPSVPLQPRSRGWSLNAAQNLGETWAVFARANRAYDYVTPIRASFAVGAAMNNPLKRASTDQIGISVGLSQPASPGTQGARNETIVEGYWNCTLMGGLLLTPDVQYIRAPAFAPARDGAWVLSLRATFMF